MTTIKLTQGGYSHYGRLYKGVSQQDEFLIQHLVNDDYIQVSETLLPKLKLVAEAHGWTIEIV